MSDRTKAWIVALASGVAGFPAAKGFRLTERWPVGARLPEVEQSVAQLDAIVSVRGEYRRAGGAGSMPSSRKPAARPNISSRANSEPKPEPLRTTTLTDAIRLGGAENRDLLEQGSGGGRGSYECSWKFDATNLGRQPFYKIATLAYVDHSGVVINYYLAAVSLEPGETRTFRGTARFYERDFHRIARVEAAFR